MRIPRRISPSDPRTAPFLFPEDRRILNEPSDGTLLDAFRRGDGQAFATLVGVHQATLLRHARALLGPRGAHEDVVQEVFLKLAQSPPDLPPEIRGDARVERAHVSSWLHTVTRNACMDTIRSETRRRRREETVAEERGDEAVADRGLTAVDAADTRALVERELGRLPTDQREVLVLRLLNEKSYREIAAITGKKVGTVGWLVSVGLKTLSRELAPLLARDGADGSLGAQAGLGLAQGEA